MKTTYDVFKYYSDRVSKTGRDFQEDIPPWCVPGLKDFLQRISYGRYDEGIMPYFVDDRLNPKLFNFVWSKNIHTKSPGAPFNSLYPSNGSLEEIKHEIYLVLNHRIHNLIDLGKVLMSDWRLLYPSSEAAMKIAVQLVEDNITDPVLIGWKGEPRTVGKNPRLVSQISVMVNMMQRLLFGDYLLLEQLDDSYTNPVAVALDLQTQSQTIKNYAEFYHVAKTHGFLSSSDVQGWEYSVNRRLRYMDAFKIVYRLGLCDLDNKPYPGKEDQFFGIWGLVYTLVNKVTQTQEGKVVFHLTGQMSSGELCTFSSNSFIRSWLSNEISLKLTGEQVRYVKSAGDDNLDTNDRADELYLERGFVITDYLKQIKEFDFCSTKFTNHGSYLINIDKFVYAAVMNKRSFENDDTLSSEFDALYKNHPNYTEYKEALIELYHIHCEAC